MSKRNWRKWPSRFVAEANSSSGVFGIAGIGLAAGGVLLAVPAAAALGGIATVGMLGWCALRSVPLANVDAASIAGRQFSDFSILDRIDPPLTRIGFVGVSRSGKSTLLGHIIAQITPAVRTDDIYTVVTNIPGSPNKFFALIDAAGQQFSQQFQILDESEHVFILLDHNSSETSSNIDQVRLEQHSQLLQQLAGHLRKSPNKPKNFHFLLNKRDLWQGTADETSFRTWIDQQEATWKVIPNIVFSACDHSNFKAEDTPKVIQRLRDWA